MLENILFAIVGFFFGASVTTTFFIVKVFKPMIKKEKEKKRRQQEAKLLMGILQVTDSIKEVKKPNWKKDGEGHIISPLQKGREGS